MNKRADEHRITLRETLLGLIVIALIFLVAEHGFRTVESFELKTLDMRFQAREVVRRYLPGLISEPPEVMPLEKIVVAGIDESTKDMIEKFEVSRDLHAAAVENLFRAGVSNVTMDVVFDKELNEDSDTGLARTLKRHRDQIVIGGQWKAPGTGGSGFSGDSLTLPARPFQESGARIGLVNSVLSADAVVRALPLVLERKSINLVDTRSVDLYPGLAFATWLNWKNSGRNLNQLGIEPGQTGMLKLPDLEVQTARSFVGHSGQQELPTVFRNMIVNFQGPINTFRCLSLADVVDLARLEERLFRWNIVLQDGKLQGQGGQEITETPQIEFQTFGDGQIAGQVSGLQPGEKAEIIAYSFRHGLFSRAMAAADGSFSIQGLKADEYRLSLQVVSEDGLGRTEIGVGLVSVKAACVTKGVHLHVPRGDARVNLNLTVVGTQAVQLQEVNLKMSQPTVSVKTDALGNFVFEGLPSGPAKLTATVIDEDTYDTIALKEDLVVHTGSGKAPYSILYHREKGFITGRLIHADGTPLQGATVAAFQPIPSDAPIFRHYRYFVDQSDSDGVFRLGRILEAGLFNLSVTIPQEDGTLQVCFEPRGVWVPSPVYRAEPVSEWFQVVDLQVEDGLVIGRVVDQAGQPRPDVPVKLSFFSLNMDLHQKVVDNHAEFSHVFPGKYILAGFTSRGKAPGDERFQHLSLNNDSSLELTLDSLEIANEPPKLSDLQMQYPEEVDSLEVQLISSEGLRTSVISSPGTVLFKDLPSGYYHVLASGRNKDGAAVCGTVNLADFSLRDSVVFVGTRARLDLDYYSTPFDSDFFRLFDHIDQMFGVEIHAHFFHTLANNAGIHRLSRGMNRLILAFLMLLVLFWMQRHTFIRGFARIIMVFTGLIFLSGYTFIHYRLWIDLWLPLVGLMTIYLFSVSYRYQQEQKRKKQIRGIFEAMVPPSVVDQCLKNDGMAEVSGKREYLSVLFSDIRGFTPMSESMTPEEVVGILNEYMGEMTKIIFENKGTLDKFIGDAIMVIFGAPVPYDDHAYWAVRCADKMREKLQELRRKWGAEGKFVINVGIGVNTGDMVVGNMGSKERMNYTVIGDAVNLSARLEANTKGGQILISAETFKHIKDKVIFEKPDPIKVKGKSMLITIYDIKGMKEDLVGEPVPVIEEEPVKEKPPVVVEKPPDEKK